MAESKPLITIDENAVAQLFLAGAVIGYDSDKIKETAARLVRDPEGEFPRLKPK